MKALFFDSTPPCIIIKFDNASYRYKGFENGELNLLKREYYKKVGKLIDYLKSKSYIKYERLIGI